MFLVIAKQGFHDRRSRYAAVCTAGNVRRAL